MATYKKYIDPTANNPITLYTSSDQYNSVMDNIPFHDIESRGDFLSALHQNVGEVRLCKYLKNTDPTLINLQAFDWVAIKNQTSEIVALSGTSTTCFDFKTSDYSEANLLEEYQFGMVYPVDNSSGIIAFADDFYYYIYVVISSSHLAVPITKQTTPSYVLTIGTEDFEGLTWTAHPIYDREYSATNNGPKVGDYLYLAGVRNGTAIDWKILAIPGEADVSSNSFTATDKFIVRNAEASTGTYTGEFMRLGRIISITDNEYILFMENHTEFGTHLFSSVTTHQGLTDIAAETPATPTTGTWVYGHTPYQTRILTVSETIVIPDTVTPPVKGDLTEFYDNSGTQTFRKSTASQVAMLAGVYFGSSGTTPNRTFYFLTHGEWDPAIFGATNLAGIVGTTYPDDLGKTVWDNGSSVAGAGSLTVPAYSGTSETKEIRRVGWLHDTGDVVYVDIVNDLTKILNYGYYRMVLSGSSIPEAQSNRMLSGSWDWVLPTTLTLLSDLEDPNSGFPATSVVGSPYYRGDDKTVGFSQQTDPYVPVSLLAKINPDIPLSIQKLINYKSGSDYIDLFALTENCFANDLIQDLGTVDDTSNEYALDAWQLNQYLILDPSNTYTDYDHDILNNAETWYTAAGANGSFRMGDRDWQSCIGYDCATPTSSVGTDIATIVYSASAKTIICTPSSGDIYWWKDIESDIALGLKPKIPEIGIMVLAHAIAANEKACLFSYEGYELDLTGHTFTFKNVVIKSDSVPTWVQDPTFSTGTPGDWVDGTTTDWYLLPFLVGGLRLRIENRDPSSAATGVFNTADVVPPLSDSLWWQYKKCGIMSLGSDDSTAYGEIDGGGKSGWDYYDDASTATYNFWAQLDTAIATTGFSTTYSFDDVPTHTYDQLDLTSYTALEVGPVHRAFPKPGQVSSTMSGAGSGTWASSGNIHTLTAGGATDPATQYITENKKEAIIGARLDTDTDEGLLIMGIDGSGNLLVYSSSIPNSYSTNWTIYTTTDDLVNSPSLAVMNTQEIWVDISKKSNFRAYSMTFSIKNATVNDMLDIAVAQSGFYDGIRTLKAMAVGTELFRNLVEGDRVRCFIKSVGGNPNDEVLNT